MEEPNIKDNNVPQVCVLIRGLYLSVSISERPLFFPFFFFDFYPFGTILI